MWISGTYAPNFDADGNVEAVIKIATDITARRTGIERIGAALSDLSDGNLEQEVAPCGAADLDRLCAAFTAMPRFPMQKPNVYFRA